jgi:RNA polymerase sigma-70 factor (ECF subfamily)
VVCVLEQNSRTFAAGNSIDRRRLRDTRPHAPRRSRGRQTTRPASLIDAAPSVAGTVPTETDELLIKRLRQGDVAAGDALVQRYYKPLMRYLQWLAGADAAADLHQQTWLSVLDHLDGFNTGSAAGGFKAWLFRIASNKAKDQWRSRGRERDAKAGLGRIVDDELPDASYAFDRVEQGEKLKEAIELLPEGQRQVLVLRYYSNLKFVDIADMLGCPLNTALTRAHKGITKLRHLMCA